MTQNPQQSVAALIRARMDAYLAAFQSMSVERTLPFYHSFGIVLGPMGALHLGSKAEAAQFLEQNFAQMRAQHYQSSRWGAFNVFVLAPTIVLVSTVWERLDAQGQFVSHSGATYQLVLQDNEWVIVSVIMHAADNLLPSS
jgi:hypothetical protein